MICLAYSYWMVFYNFVSALIDDLHGPLESQYIQINTKYLPKAANYKSI